MEDIGITVAAFEANRDLILRWLSHAIEIGAFEERDLSDYENKSVQESPSDANDSLTKDGFDAPSIIGSTEVYRGTEYHNSTPSSDQELPFRSRCDHIPIFTQSLPVDECGPSRQQEIPSPTLATPIEYSVSCERCGKFNIAYDLHMHCDKCNDGDHNLCLQCWRHGRGCLNWYGFGQVAVTYWNHTTSSNPSDLSKCAPPHILVGRQYRSVAILAPPAGAGDCEALTKTSSHSSMEILSGFFCSNCSAFAHDNFWACDICNDGEWGYCVVCIRRGRCCTHPLLHFGAHPSSNIHPSSSVEPQQLDIIPQVSPVECSVECSICDLPIPPSGKYFHCPQCDGGAYDVCIDCYLRLVNNGQITEENGPRGWRRCLKGHRMIIFGFGITARGQRFVVINDLVGGHASNVPDTSLTSCRHPTSRGSGLRVSAQWSYWPKEGDDDELAFPRGAEIRECENVNGDWSWGVYCGRKGLFPSSYCKVIAEDVNDYIERCNDPVSQDTLVATNRL